MEQIKRLFRERVNRAQWILGILVVSLSPSVFLAIIAQFDNQTVNAIFPFIAGLLLIPAFALSISLHVRRMHDTNRNGLYIILAFIPFVNFYYLYLLFKRGDESADAYGELPKRRGVISVILNTQ